MGSETRADKTENQNSRECKERGKTHSIKDTQKMEAYN